MHLVEDYLTYWLHRFLHTKWGYEKIHHVHHEKTAPSGFAPSRRPILTAPILACQPSQSLLGQQSFHATSRRTGFGWPSA
jgi:hypothetical protein